MFSYSIFKFSIKFLISLSLFGSQIYFSLGMSESEQTLLEDVCENYINFNQKARCQNPKSVWYFSSGLQKCIKTNKLGCSNETFVFQSERKCLKTCGPQKACKMGLEYGDCRANLVRFYFNTITGQCEEFSYRGCGGNYNRFKTIEDCQKTCADFIKIKTTTVQPNVVELITNQIKIENFNQDNNDIPYKVEREILLLRHGEEIENFRQKFYPNVSFEEVMERGFEIDANFREIYPKRENYSDFILDTPITESASGFAFLLGRHFKKIANFDIEEYEVLTSPSLRCVETGHEFLKGAKGENEMILDYAAFTHNIRYEDVKFLTLDEFSKNGIPVNSVQNFNFEYQITHREKTEKFLPRVNKLINQMIYSDKNFILITHGFLIEEFGKTVLDYNKSDFLPYSGMHQFTYIDKCVLYQANLRIGLIDGKWKAIKGLSLNKMQSKYDTDAKNIWKI